MTNEVTIARDETDSEQEDALVAEEDVTSDELQDEETNDDIEGDHEYELTRDEGQLTSANKWKVTFMKADFAEELIESIKKIKPFTRCARTGHIITTKSYRNLVEGVVLFLDCGRKVPPKVLKTLSLEVFGPCDILYGVIKDLPKAMKKFSALSTWWNLYNFLRFVPNPNTRILPRLFQLKYHHLKSKSKRKLISSYEKVWLELMACTIPNSLLLVVVPYIIDNVLGILREPHKTSDFFFSLFDRGDIYAIISLSAIFKLIVTHNFEYPKFYDEVYALTTSSVLYLDQKKKFFDLLDTFLTSTHIPIYIVAGFIKRLSRLLLEAPLDAQEPLMGLIRNLITRFPILVPLMHRDLPQTLESDPYDVNEPCLSKCNGLDSSLWEIKTLQHHWSSSVSKRAKFLDSGLQKLESFVRFRCQDEYFSILMAKRYGKNLDSIEEKYIKEQDGSDEEPTTKKAKTEKPKKKFGKFQKKHEAKQVRAIPTNFTPPTGDIFPENSFNFEYDKYWTI